ncbi:holin [Chromobacterium subtsugae]|uniref:holin n=1 Tax=Chromobacterium subtsugae TaxID=251747 RepID=UPI000640D607|nr:holin [Chromobacterium subtsugae]
MQDHEKGLVLLVCVGAAIGLGKLLVSNEQITLRLALGRSIMGSAASTVAGVVLMQVPDLPLPALMGIGSAAGILGAQYLEVWLKGRLERMKR